MDAIALPLTKEQAQYEQVKRAYEDKRAKALMTATTAVREAYGLGKEFYLAPLNPCVMNRIKAWPPELKGWHTLENSTNNLRPRNFHAAFFLGKEVVAATFGRVSRGRTQVRIDMLEKRSGTGALKDLVIPIAINAAIHYAIEIQAKRVLITDPVDEPQIHAAYNYYSHAFIPPGYSPFRKGHYTIFLS